jgi:type II secretory pathway pseudopilin PulG
MKHGFQDKAFGWRHMIRSQRFRRGVAGLELMVVLVVLLAAVSIAVPLFLNRSTLDRENLTLQRMLSVKNAIIGTAGLEIDKADASFGFVGDLGILPPNLTWLMVQGTYPDYGMSGNVWYGWHGPYLDNRINNNGSYVALLDGWGNPLNYRFLGAGPPYWSAEIRSAGPDGDLTTTADNIVVSILETETRTFVQGTFKDRSQTPISEEGVTVYFPNGTATLDSVLITTTGAKITYDSSTDIVSAEEKRRIPIGIRYFETRSMTLKKLAALNGSGAPSFVSFIGESSSNSSPFTERTFYTTDDISAETGSLITPRTGTWSPDHQGTYYASGAGEHLAVFGRSDWDNYRVEVDATLYQGRGYGVYYRCDGQTNITGYIFQYDPGMHTPLGSGIELVIRKVYQGDENYFPASERYLARIRMSATDFYFRFGSSIYNDQHHISITVNDDRHIVKLDGQEIIDVTDTEPLFPCGGLCGMAGLRSWDGLHYADFHHILVYPIPPVPTGEFAWWSFEEGSGETVYGSGFEIDEPELNGKISWDFDLQRVWNSFNIHGKCLQYDGWSWGNVSFGNIYAIRPSDTFSVSMWFRMPYINESYIYTLLSKSNNFGNNNSRGWLLRLRKENGYAFGVEFSLHSVVGINQRELVVLNNLNGQGLREDTWYHVVVVYDGSLNPSGGNRRVDPSVLRIYVTPQDRAQVDTSPPLEILAQTLHTRDNTQNGVAMKLGNENLFQNGFYGFIDEFKVYNYALTPEEIEELFQRDK